MIFWELPLFFKSDCIDLSDETWYKRKTTVSSTNRQDCHSFTQEVNRVSIHSGNWSRQYTSDEWSQLPGFIKHLLRFATDYATNHGDPFTRPTAVYTNKNRKRDGGQGRSCGGSCGGHGSDQHHQTSALRNLCSKEEPDDHLSDEATARQAQIQEITDERNLV